MIAVLASSAGSAAVHDKPVASRFQAARAHIVIDRPAADIWLVLTDLSYPTLKLWNPTVVRVAHLSGEPRQENEFVLVTKNTGQAPFYMRTVRIVANQHRVLRCDAVDGSYSTFVDHTLYELAGKTLVVYNGYIEVRKVPVDDVGVFDQRKADADMMEYLNQAFELLKKAVEERPPTSSPK